MWALQQEEVVRTAAAPYAAYFCYGALATAVLLSWYHDQARLLCVAFALGVMVWGLERLPVGADEARLACILLLPLNFVFFEWLDEGRVLTLIGLLRIGFVCVQVLAVAWLAFGEGGPLSAILHWGEKSGGLPWIVQTSFAVTAIVLMVLLFRRRNKLEQGLLWALAAVFLGARHIDKAETLLFYAGAAGMILVFAVLEQGYELATRDELTGLPGRRAFNSVMGQLGRRYAIAMCDVDHFKKFNDVYGHEAGDQVLRMVASKLSQVQGGGEPFRYGGEEFVIVFRGRSAREAQPFIESLRKSIAETAFVPRGPDRPLKKPHPLPEQKNREAVTITISAGLAERSKRHSTPELVLDDADAALYRAKESGRNCIVVRESTSPSGILRRAAKDTPEAS